MKPDQLAADLTGTAVSTQPIVERPNGRACYLVSGSDGRRWALKLYGQDLDAYRTEKATLEQLAAFDAPTPHVIATKIEEAALLLSWVGEQTLDAVISHDRDDPQVSAALRSLLAVDLIFADLSGSRSESDQLIDEHLRERDRKELASTARACRSINPDLFDAEDLLRPVYEIAWQGSWNYGSLDCSASNLVSDGRSVAVVDFSVLGAEWVERRLVSYLIASGARGAADHFTCAVTTPLALELIGLFEYIGGGGYRPELLGVHRFLALLTALDRFETGAAGPQSANRRKSLLTALAEPVARPDEVTELVHEMGLDRLP